MKTFLVLSLFLTLTSCGKKDESLKSNEIEIGCKTLRKEASALCEQNRRAINQVQSQNEVCILGPGTTGVIVSIIPSSVKANVDSGALILRNKETRKKMFFKQVEGTDGDLFLIVQQEGDIGNTSSVSLPICPQ